jgi:hypothetical protein
LEPLNLPKWLRLMGTGSLHGGSPSRQHDLFSHTAKPNLTNTMTTSHPTLHLSI